MANICNFSMVVKGKKENIETFQNMMTQTGTVYMGRGAGIDGMDMEDLEDGTTRCQIEGQTKWSVCSSLVDDAVSMRNDIDKWYFDEDVDVKNLSFITLFEACEQLNIDMECYSEEPGCCFQEHYLWKDNELVKDECVDYREWYDEESGEWETEGGFEEWAFEL